MKVFVTGATGFVGSAVVKELVRNGHEVTGLARSESAEKALLEAGAKSHRGDLEDLQSLKEGAKLSDGIIHTGFIHDFSRFKESCEIDRKAILAIGDAIRGTQKPFLITSGIGLLSQGRMTIESDTPSVDTTNPRVITEITSGELKREGLNISLVRLPPSVHGEGDHGFVPMLIQFAKEKKYSAYIGSGENKWPAIHRFDAAKIYRLALEKGISATYHAVAEEGIAFKNIAEIISKRLNVPLVSLTLDAAQNHFTWFSHFAAFDVPTSSEWTKKALNWEPRERGLLDDIDQKIYFE